MRLAERHGDSEKGAATLMVERGVKIYHATSEGGHKTSWSLETTGLLEMVISGCGEAPVFLVTMVHSGILKVSPMIRVCS